MVLTKCTAAREEDNGRLVDAGNKSSSPELSMSAASPCCSGPWLVDSRETGRVQGCRYTALPRCSGFWFYDCQCETQMRRGTPVNDGRPPTLLVKPGPSG